MKRVTPEKVSIYKGFHAFEKSRSGNRLHAPKLRALPAAPHPDGWKYSIFWGQIRKWSNLWSKVFCRNTRRRKSEETREKRRFCELSAVGSRGGHTLPNFARYQLRHTPRFSYVGKYIPNNTSVNIVNDTYLGICRAPARQCAVPGQQVSQTNKQALILYYSSVRLSQFRKSCAPISESVGTMRSAPHLRQNTRTASSVASAS